MTYKIQSQIEQGKEKQIENDKENFFDSIVVFDTYKILFVFHDQNIWV